MDILVPEELHHMYFDINETPLKSNLLATAPNGLIFVALKSDLAVFTTNDYAQASSSFSQRKDKALAGFRPNLSVSFPRTITWLSVNCSGSLLLVAYGSSIQLLCVQHLSNKSLHGLLGDPLELEASEGCIHDLSWNPADKHRFTIVTSNGSVRMFGVNLLQQPNISPLRNLPPNVQAHCLSWSPKGKQLALAVTGDVGRNTPNSTSGNLTSIVQVDPDLKVKRIIPVGDLLKDRLKDFGSPRPIDILWTSSYCFLLGVEDADPTKGIQLVFITALPKSETRLNGLPDFASFSNSKHHYHLRLVPNSINLVAFTWSQDAEECFLLEVPSISTSAESTPPDSLPRLITSLPLPTDGSPIALDIGALLDGPDPIPMVLGLLNNGALFAFKISPPRGDHPQSPLSSIFAGFKLWCGSADKQPRLPNEPSPDLALGDTSNTPGSTGLASSTTTGITSGLAFGKPITSDRTSASTPNIIGSGPIFGVPTNPDVAEPPVPVSSTPNAESTPSTAPLRIAPGFSLGNSVITDPTPAATVTAASPITTDSGFMFGKSTGADSAVSTSAINDISRTGPLQQSPSKARTPVSVNSLSKTTAADEESPVAQSIIDAANQFSKALKSQAEASARAWSHLHNVFEGNSKNLQQAPDKNGNVRRGVWDIEQSLSNMDDFLGIIDEITSQLKKASLISVTEQRASSDYLERLSVDFDMFNRRVNENRLATMAAGLDPEAANMLAALKRKSRAAETCLAELEDQIESLTARLEARNERSCRLPSRNRLGLQISDIENSALDKIHAAIATNSRLIKYERSRLELISEMAGISLNDSSAMKLKNPQPGSQMVPSLGGSAISIDREQHDTMFYRFLCSADIKPKLKDSKKVTSIVDNRIPVAKASSTVTEVIASIRKLEDARDKTSIQSTSKQASMSKSGEKISSLVSSSLTAKSPVGTKQLSSHGKQKNLEISKLLASAESVPPVTLANRSSHSKPPRSSLASAANDAAPVSTPLPNTVGKLKLPSAADSRSESTSLASSSVEIPVTSKPSIFVPSASRSLTSPTRATTIAAPTTKVFGAPKANVYTDNFKPLSPRLSSASADDSTISTTALQSPDSVPKPSATQATPTIAKPLSGNVFASSTASSDVIIPVTTKIPASNLFGVKPATCVSESPRVPSTFVAFPPSVSVNEPAKVTFGTTPSTSANEPTKSLFGAIASATDPTDSSVGAAVAVPTSAGQPPLTFGTTATAIIGTSTTTVTTTKLFSVPGSATFTTAPSTTQPISVFGNAAPSPASLMTQPTSIFSTPLAATASGQSSSLFVPPITATTAPFSQFSGTIATTAATNQPTSLFGIPASKLSAVSTTSAPGSFFGQPVASQSVQSSGLFGQLASSAVGQPGGIFAKPGSTGGLFGQAAAATSTSSTSGGLFGLAVPITTTAASPGLFGQVSPTPGGLFGQISTAAATQPGGLFGQSTAPVSTPAGGLFGQSAPAAVSPSGGLFGQSTTPAGGLFGQLAGSTVQPSASGLFGQPSVSTGAAAGSFGQTAATSSTPSSGLFGTVSGGLFGSPKSPESTSGFQQNVSNVSNLFATANFGLGFTPTSTSESPSIFQKPSTAGQTQNLFGSSSTTATSNKPGGLFGPSTLGTMTGGSSLFGSSSTDSNPNSGGFFSGAGQSSGGLFGNSASGSSPAGGSLFGAPAFGTSRAQTVGGLFTSTTTGGGGLFGSFTEVTPSFGAPAVFGASAFGGSSNPGNSALGTVTTTGAGGLFASLGNSLGGPTFGGLANSATQQPSTPIFGSSPSFTQRRA